jgi:proline iminopeptidase
VRISVNGVWLYFDVDGCGLAALDKDMTARPTVLLLPGGPGGDHSFFKPDFAAMTDAAQVIYLDPRGTGRSDHGDPSRWTWDQWADDVAAFCEKLEIRSPVLVGTSGGGRIAISCAVRHPDLAGGVVTDSTLFGPGSLADSLAVFERRGGPLAREAAERIFGGDTSPEANMAWRTHALPVYGSANDGDLRARAARSRTSREVFRRFRRGGCGPLEITAPELNAVRCPVLVLAGEDDPASPAASARRVTDAAGRPDLALHVFPEVAHGVFRQAPERAFGLLREFLAETGTRPDQGT